MRCKLPFIVFLLNNCSDYQSDFLLAYQYYVDNFNLSNETDKIDPNIINFLDNKLSNLINKLRNSKTNIEALMQTNKDNQYVKQILPKISDKNLKDNLLRVFQTSSSYCSNKDIMNFLNIFYLKVNNEPNNQINTQIFDIIMGSLFFISSEEIIMVMKVFSIIKQYCNDNIINNIFDATADILKDTKTSQQVQMLSLNISKKIQEISQDINFVDIATKINPTEINVIKNFGSILGIFAQVYVYIYFDIN